MSIPNFVRTACATAFTTALAVTLVAAPLWAQSAAAPPTRALRATRLSGPAPTIDGLVDEECKAILYLLLAGRGDQRSREPELFKPK